MNDMEIVRLGDRQFFLFLDIFVHWGGRKITAVAPYYGDDIDWLEHGVDLQDVVLKFGSHHVKGRYVPHRLDSWEPCVLFDFEDSVLEDNLRNHHSIAFEIRAGSFSKEFELGTAPAPGHDVAVSLIVRDCNRWLPYFLNYYLDCLECDHVYLYDNRTRDADGLQRILGSYADRGQVSYIPWHYRWRNAVDGKQIGQIPQEAHSLNKFGQCRWIGFFDYDEFLRVPGRTLKEFLKDYDPSEVDGLSFGLRWFKYVGDEALEEIDNPLLSFFDAKPDSLGRKRQKLIVSPREVRFLRIHWLEDGKKEVPVDDTDIYFHHYYLNPNRFEHGKTESLGVRDDYMLGFAEQLIRGDRDRSNIGDKGKRDGTRVASNPKPRNAEQWIAHVMDAFDIAEAENSKLSEDVMALPGMCGRRNRHFLNALCTFENCRYLEIGSHKGASLCAAMYGNETAAVAIDDWSHFDGSREAVIAATSDLTGGGELRLIEQDCFTVDPTELGPFDVYYYDGDHSTESQARALERFYDCLADRAVVVIDDWNWETVRLGTRRAMEKLDIPIIFEKEIILPEADTAGMPHHRGRDTWWNGIYVMIVDKLAAPLSHSSRQRALTGSSIGAQKQRQPIAVAIFSKDRACQLEALLRSMSRFLKHPHEITVLYAASDQSYQTGYDALSDSYPSVNWIREADFKADLIRLLREAGERGARHVMFLVDDIVFTRSFTGEQMMEVIDEDDDILALSLRLGDNICYCQPHGIATGPPDFLGGRRWAWRDGNPGYWNYPMSVDVNIYRLCDITDTLERIDFRNPNTLESAMLGHPIKRPYLVCHSSPYLVNLALNSVQDVFKTPHAGVSAPALNQCFLNGFVIDIQPFIGRDFLACHIEPTITLVPSLRRLAPGPTSTDAFYAGEESMESTIGTKAQASRDLIPVPSESIVVRPIGEGVILDRQSEQGQIWLNETSSAIWSLCDGSTTVKAILDALERRYQAKDDAIRRDVMTTLMSLESRGLLTFKGAPSRRTRHSQLAGKPWSADI